MKGTDTMSEIKILNKKSDPIIYLTKKDKRLAKVIEMVGEITYIPHDNPYEQIINSIIGQMLANRVAQVLRKRLYEMCNGNVTPANIIKLTDEQIKSIGISKSKVKSIRALTDSVVTGFINFNELESLSNEEAIKKLTAIRGIGIWSAKMFLIFTLDRPDILPFEDMAFLQSYAWMYKTSDTKPASIKKRCKKWSPYSSYATRYLYRALDMGFTKDEFHLYK